MKSFNLRRATGQNRNNVMDSSRASTAVASPEPSLSNFEKPVGNAALPEATTPYTGTGEKRMVEETPLEEAAALDKLSDEPDYPTGLKLLVISIALCLSVFLVALVSASSLIPLPLRT